jgi:hypothetical protein
MRELFSGEYLRDVSSGFESAIDLESLQGVRHFRNVHTSEVWEPLMLWSPYVRHVYEYLAHMYGLQPFDL